MPVMVVVEEGVVLAVEGFQVGVLLVVVVAGSTKSGEKSRDGKTGRGGGVLLEFFTS